MPRPRTHSCGESRRLPAGCTLRDLHRADAARNRQSRRRRPRARFPAQPATAPAHTPRAEQLDLAAVAACATRRVAGRTRESVRDTTSASAQSSRSRVIARSIFGAYVASASSCGVSGARPISISASASMSASAPISASRSCSSPYVSSSGIGVRTCTIDGPGVERLDHAHDRHARFGVSVANRRLDRRRAAQLRQQRRVDVDRARARQVDDSGREDVPVGDDDGDVRLERREAARRNSSPRGCSGCSTGIPSSSAMRLIGGAPASTASGPRPCPAA